MTITNEILKSAYDTISSGYAGLDIGIDEKVMLIDTDVLMWTSF